MASRRTSKSSRAKKRPGRPSRVRAQWRDELAEQLGGHRADILAIGLILVCATVIGLLYLDRTQGPARRAGGVLGAAIGVPLRSGLGTTGAVIVLVAAGVIGALLVVGTGIHQVVHASVVGARF